MHPKILHIANWYPNPWDPVEGIFVRAQIDLFSQISNSRVVNVQIRRDKNLWWAFRKAQLSNNAMGYYVFTCFQRGKIIECLTTLLLLLVLIRERFWRYDVLHFHIAYPLLVHAHLWKWFVRRPVLISEHWSAYHFDFFLPSDSRSLKTLRRPFAHGFPVIAVSKALRDDITRFSQRDDFPRYVIPNVVPLHGPKSPKNRIPILFAVNRWVDIKQPMPMLQGLALAAESGAEFELVIGGFGALLEPMMEFVTKSTLADRTNVLGTMSKAEIAVQLGKVDGYIFSSRYETFSVACAEALGAGVPLIGPYIPAISEYAGDQDWHLVSARDATGWEDALKTFLQKIASREFDSVAIARRATDRFAPETIRRQYEDVLCETMSVAGRRSTRDVPHF